MEWSFYILLVGKLFCWKQITLGEECGCAAPSLAHLFTSLYNERNCNLDKENNFSIRLLYCQCLCLGYLSIALEWYGVHQVGWSRVGIFGTLLLSLHSSDASISPCIHSRSFLFIQCFRKLHQPKSSNQSLGYLGLRTRFILVSSEIKPRFLDYFVHSV